MKSKFDHLIDKLKLDHRKYRELINKSHKLVEHILDMDDKIEYDQDIEQSHYNTRDHYLKHLDDIWKELKTIGIRMSKDEFHDLIDYQNIR